MTQQIQPPVPLIAPSPSNAEPVLNPLVTLQPINSTIPNGQNPNPATSPLLSLPSGTLVEGFVINRDPANNPIIRTNIGDLRVSSDVFLKTGSEVVFKVDATQTSHARIVSVDGLSLQIYSKQTVHPLTHDTITHTLLQQSGTGAATIVGQRPGGPPLLQALILQGSPATAMLVPAQKQTQSAPPSILTQLAQLRPGSPVQLAVLDLKFPPLPITLASVPDSPVIHSLLPAPPTRSAASLPTASAPQTPAAPATAPASLPRTVTPDVKTAPSAATPPAASIASPPTLPAPIAKNTGPEIPSSPIPVDGDAVATAPTPQAASAPLNASRIANYGKTGANLTAPPTTSAPASTPSFTNANPQRPASPDNPVIEATVIGHEGDGANILHTPFATLKLYTSHPLPTGTTLVIETSLAPENAENAAPAAPATPEEPQYFDRPKPQPWAAMDEAIRVLQQISPDIAAELARRLPTLNYSLASRFLFMITALKEGDVAAILGNRALRLLENSAPGILSRLRKDMETLRDSLIEPSPRSWSALPIPLLLGQMVDHVRLWVQQEPKREDATSDLIKGQRFLLEVEMSALGTIQLDGFVKQQQQHKHFELIVRSEQPLDEAIRQGIRTIFQDALATTGLGGQVAFQAGQQHFILPATGQKTATGPNTILA